MEKQELREKIRKALVKDRVLIKVATNTGLSLGTIYQFRDGRGNPSKVTLRVMAEYLGIEQDG